MAEITQEARSPKARDLFNKGFAAMERGSLDYAIDMLTACIDLEPGFMQARRFLRAAEIKRARDGGTGPVKQAVDLVKGLSPLLRTYLMLHSKKPMQALEAAEKLMRINPLHREFIKALGKAAVAADFPEIAVQTLAATREFFPEDPFILNWLGTLYLETGQPKLARDCFEKLAELRPTDAKAVKSLKDAMAIDSMTKDGWAEAADGKGSFRGMIRDEKEAVLIEQEAKSFKTEKDIDALIAETQEKIKREPANMNYRRHLASLYAQKKGFDEAVQALRDALALMGNADPQIDNAIAGYRLQQFDHRIAECERASDAAGAANLRAEKEAFFFSNLQERVGRYPNDLPLRFELGAQFFKRGDVNEAIQQFQLSQRSPHERVRSLYYIARCFRQKKQYDMAIDQLELAASEVPALNELKKDILYELGEIHDLTGQHDKALEHFKAIYQVDIGYKDVAKKIEKGYSA